VTEPVVRAVGGEGARFERLESKVKGFDRPVARFRVTSSR